MLWGDDGQDGVYSGRVSKLRVCFGEGRWDLMRLVERCGIPLEPRLVAFPQPPHKYGPYEGTRRRHPRPAIARHRGTTHAVPLYPKRPMRVGRQLQLSVPVRNTGCRCGCENPRVVVSQKRKKKKRMRLPLRFDVHMIPSDGLERVEKESRWGENEEVGNLHRGP